MPCHMQFQLRDRGILSPQSNEYIDLFDDSEPMEVKREKMAGIQKLKMLSACRYCVGFDAETVRCAPAVQLTEEELRSIERI